jgi:ribokinase
VPHVVDTTAAGDCFNGALAVALAEGKDLTDAARFATAAAALSVTRAGAQPSLPTRAEVVQFAL